MIANIKIQSCSCFDWPTLSSLANECFPERSKNLFRFIICRHKENVRILIIDGIIIGFYVFYHSRDKGELWLDYIGIAEKYRGKNFGLLLLEDVDKIALKRGYSKIGLAIDRDNTPAIRLYTTHGYECVATGVRLGFSKTIASGHQMKQRPIENCNSIVRTFKFACWRIVYWALVDLYSRQLKRQ